jgi:hypothetical protein
MVDMETRVTYRASEETVRRLQELSDKYGVSQSALLTMLVNERWLVESRAGQEQLVGQSKPSEVMREERSDGAETGVLAETKPLTSFSGNIQPVSGRKKRRRHRKK